MVQNLLIELLDAPENDFIDFVEKHIEEFNVARWEIKEKKPIGVQIKDSNGEIIAGATGKTFGLWLLIDNLWVSEEMRNCSLGSKALLAIEEGAKNRGCRFVLLDTLNFQAQPFYEKHGYKVQWVQEQYPQTGCKYFMMKVLQESV